LHAIEVEEFPYSLAWTVKGVKDIRRTPPSLLRSFPIMRCGFGMLFSVCPVLALFFLTVQVQTDLEDSFWWLVNYKEA
jgi:hypothetical protein